MYRSIARPRHAAALLLGCSLSSQALAAAGYDSSVTLSYSIAVVNSTNSLAGDTTGLAIFGTYQQPTDEFSFYASAGGDGSDQAGSPNPPATTIAGTFDAAFTASGSAHNGSVDSLHTGLCGLTFSNDGLYEYDLAVSLDYALHAAANGEFATSAILFDYWDDANQLSGADYSAAATLTGQLQDQQSAAGSAIWAFTLAPGATAGLYAQAGIESHLASADASPVPLPGAVWLFTSVLGGFGMSAFRKRQILAIG